MVDDVIWSESHTKRNTGWMKMTRYASSTVDILTNTLGRERERGREREIERERQRE